MLDACNTDPYSSLRSKDTGEAMLGYPGLVIQVAQAYPRQLLLASKIASYVDEAMSLSNGSCPSWDSLSFESDFYVYLSSFCEGVVLQYTLQRELNHISRPLDGAHDLNSFPSCGLMCGTPLSSVPLRKVDALKQVFNICALFHRFMHYTTWPDLAISTCLQLIWIEITAVHFRP